MTNSEAILYSEVTSHHELHQVVQLQTEIWGQDVVSPLPQLLATIHHGGIIIAAFSEGEMVGFNYGFPGVEGDHKYLVSHMTGIVPGFQNKGIGFGLKMKQKKLASSLGYKKIVWTYDPLEARNGFFNICKLGAKPTKYLEAYYGQMTDKINKALPADRLLMEWCIDQELHKARSAKKHDETVSPKKYAIKIKNGSPYVYDLEKILQNSLPIYVTVPSNIHQIKEEDIELAKAWRFTIREAVKTSFTHGYRITNMVKNEQESTYSYVLTKND
ncbi:GNAT family N-acetyltransferase [Bacillus horti]|uniref:GNAT superfamily acetyltransferase n=1 Tax=Caldalkalibacillus horti TaxID=77523 RepID=A0ABT9W1V7_9BACI|nr:GNAT family N-acetyltransferase [Bacillus horti]MDQ0166830.1 putative GNAT superfamily acetyltransferase [Bacillus horti]